MIIQNHAHLSSICFDTLLLVFFNFETAMCHIYYIAISHSWISSPFTSKMFYVGLPRYLGLNSGQSVSINVNRTRKYFSRNIHGPRMFLQCFPVSHVGKIVSSVSFCFQYTNYAYTTWQGIYTCEQFEQRPNFRALSNWMGPFDTPTCIRCKSLIIL